MNEQEKALFEKQLREKIVTEQREKERARKAAWRERNREHIRQYDRVYRLKKKLYKEGRENDEQRD